MTAAKNEGFPSVLFIHRASVEAADQFFTKRAPTAQAIADQDGHLFAAFGLGPGKLLQLVGPAVWWRALVALVKGNFVGKPSGNETQMPGAFLVNGQSVKWQYVAGHAGDHPKVSAIMDSLSPKAATTTKTKKKPSSGALKKLQKEYAQVMTQARDLQRSGDIQGFAAKTAEAEDLGKQLDAMEREQR